MYNEPDVNKLFEKISDLEGALARAQAGGDGGHAEGHASAHASSSAGRAGEAEAPRIPSRGGWMPKMASMCSAIYKGDHDYARKLADRFTNESPMLHQLVEGKKWWT